MLGVAEKTPESEAQGRVSIRRMLRDMSWENELTDNTTSLRDCRLYNPTDQCSLPSTHSLERECMIEGDQSLSQSESLGSLPCLLMHG